MPDITQKTFYLGPPEGRGYYAVGTSVWHDNLPIWVHVGGTLGEVTRGAANFINEGIETEDGRDVAIYYVSADGKAQGEPIQMTWRPDVAV